jgi:hypothetical protein
MNLVDNYSEDPSMYTSPSPLLDETWINVHLTLSPEHYHSEIYDIILDKMIHQYHGLKHPYEKGHLSYTQCPICPRFNDIAIRRYSRVGDASTQFKITVVFPDKTQLQIHVEEKKPDKQTVHLHFQVDVSMIQTSYVMMKQSVKMQDFLLSWMNSLLMELQKQSKIYQEKKEFEMIEKQVESAMYDAMYFLRSSLF